MKKTLILIYCLLLGLSALVACSSETTLNEQQNKWEVPLLKMKFSVNFGMEADILVDSISNDGIVTYRYYDYQHSDKPNSKQETKHIEDFLKMHKSQNEEFPEYIIKMYLDYGDFVVEINVSDSYINEFRKNEQVTQEIALQLNKPLDKKTADLLMVRK